MNRLTFSTFPCFGSISNVCTKLKWIWIIYSINGKPSDQMSLWISNILIFIMGNFTFSWHFHFFGSKIQHFSTFGSNQDDHVFSFQRKSQEMKQPHINHYFSFQFYLSAPFFFHFWLPPTCSSKCQNYLESTTTN